MFRACKEYDGSDTSKCITLTPGDTLSAVHALDETWFIGFNERTGEIGAFPIDCVEAVGNAYGPLPVEDKEGHKMDEKTIYANVSKQIQSRKAAESRSGNDIDPVERSRTLSAHARTFDVNKFRATKPEKTFRLTMVRKGSGEAEQGESTSTDPNDPRRPSLVRPEEVFSLGTSTEAPAEEGTEGPKVKFSEIKLEHSISADSVASWQDSFEMSYESAHYANPVDVIGKGKPMAEKPDDGNYHKLKRPSFQKDAASRCGAANTVLKIVFAVLASLVVLGLLFVILVFSFGYTMMESGIITGVSALVMGICIAFSPLCRCIMPLVLPNLVSGKGRCVYLVIMLGILMSYPVLNITYNMKETTRSLACLTELAENQSKAMEGQLAQPYSDIAGYIDRQSKELNTMASDIDGALGKVGAHLNNFYASLAQTDTRLAEIVQQCKQVFIDSVNRCATECSNAPEIKGQCLQACSFMYKVSNECESLKDKGKADAINDAAGKARTAIEGVNNYFNVDIRAVEETNTGTNSSSLVNVTQDDITKDFAENIKDFETFIAVAQKILSFSLLLLFLQSFWYIRGFISRDTFENIYITKEFKVLDRANENSTVLPLKESELNDYVDTSSCWHSAVERMGCRSGIGQVALHFILSVFVVLFDFVLYHILVTVREFGENGQHNGSGNTYRLNVTGSSHVAEFYRVLLKGINLDESFTMSLDVSQCLPDPVTPSIAIIAVLSVLYFLGFIFVVFRGYGMRLRRNIAAFYYPEHESARMEYLHKNILLKRKIFDNSLDQQIKSSHREYMVLQKLSLKRRFVQCLIYLDRFIPALNKCVPKLTKLKCTGCQQKDNQLDVVLQKCTGEHDGVLCEAAYCEDCRFVLHNRCPICSADDHRQ